MDLEQRKLSKEEWDSLEISVSPEELKILKMIYDGFDNPGIVSNTTSTLLNYIKLSIQDDPNGNKRKGYDNYLYKEYFHDNIVKMFKKHNLELNYKNTNNKQKLKKADLIRIENFETKLNNIKHDIFEFVLIDKLEQFLEADGAIKNKLYYTLKHLLKYKITNINSIICEHINHVINLYDESVSKIDFIENAYQYIERNSDLVRYKDLRLYKHQRDVFVCCKQEGPKMIMYQAPTGMGKTLTPIGLTKNIKLYLFVQLNMLVYN